MKPGGSSKSNTNDRSQGCILLSQPAGLQHSLADSAMPAEIVALCAARLYLVYSIFAAASIRAHATANAQKTARAVTAHIGAKSLSHGRLEISRKFLCRASMGFWRSTVLHPKSSDEIHLIAPVCPENWLVVVQGNAVLSDCRFRKGPSLTHNKNQQDNSRAQGPDDPRSTA